MDLQLLLQGMNPQMNLLMSTSGSTLQVKNATGIMYHYNGTFLYISGTAPASLVK